MRIISALILALFLSGCASDARDQAAADAYAGAQAMGRAVPDLGRIANGVAVNALATRGARTPADLPAPQMAPDQILSDPGKYDENAKKTHGDSLGAGFWAALGGGALLVLGIAQRLGLGGPVVGLLSTVLENTAAKDQKRKERELASFGVKAIEIVEDLPEDLSATIKKQVSKAVTPDQEKAIRQVLEERSKA